LVIYIIHLHTDDARSNTNQILSLTALTIKSIAWDNKPGRI